MAERVQVQVRMPVALQLKLKAKHRRHQRELGSSTWSFNDELVSLLEGGLLVGPLLKTPVQMEKLRKMLRIPAGD
jgi:hypothetical protein